jgi:hypothetical protein
MTKREQILETIAEKLREIPELSESIFRSRVDALTRDESPAVLVEPLADQAEQTTIPRLDWTLTARVSVIVRGDSPHQIADPFVEAIHSRITEDLSLGGLALDVQPSNVSFQFLAADQIAGVVEMDFRIIYKTDLKNLSTI